MRMSVDWKNITIKGVDLLKFTIFVITVVWGLSGVYNKLNKIIDNQEVSAILLKDYGIRLSALELEQKLMKQDIDNYKASSRDAGSVIR